MSDQSYVTDGSGTDVVFTLPTGENAFALGAGVWPKEFLSGRALNTNPHVIPTFGNAPGLLLKVPSTSAGRVWSGQGFLTGEREIAINDLGQAGVTVRVIGRFAPPPY